MLMPITMNKLVRAIIVLYVRNNVIMYTIRNHSNICENSAILTDRSDVPGNRQKAFIPPTNKWHTIPYIYAPSLPLLQ